MGIGPSVGGAGEPVGGFELEGGVVLGEDRQDVPGQPDFAFIGQ